MARPKRGRLQKIKLDTRTKIKENANLLQANLCIASWNSFRMVEPKLGFVLIMKKLTCHFFRSITINYIKKFDGKVKPKQHYSKPENKALPCNKLRAPNKFSDIMVIYNINIIFFSMIKINFIMSIKKKLIFV